MKPEDKKLAEEILMKICNDKHDYSLYVNASMSHITAKKAIEAMHEYHEAKLKEELIKYEIFHGNGSDYQIEEWINNYLKQREK